MTSWKPKHFPLHRFSTGDLVELRDQAEKGLQIAYRVRYVCADGTLLLHNLSTTDCVSVPAEDAHSSVCVARASVLAEHGQAHIHA